MKFINKIYNFFIASFSRHFYCSTIIKTVETEYKGNVYNLSIEEDETFVANGFVVHNCRSTTSPLFKDEVSIKNGKLTKKNLGGTRASIDGQVSADLSYNDWLKRQSKQFQIDTLGKTKADLFRKGGLSVDKFVNNRGQALTLDQLKEKYPIEWGKI